MAYQKLVKPIGTFLGDQASAQVRAADCILDHAKEAIELEDIEARVSELEAAAKRDAPQKR